MKLKANTDTEKHKQKQNKLLQGRVKETAYKQ